MGSFSPNNNYVMNEPGVKNDEHPSSRGTHNWLHLVALIPFVSAYTNHII